MSIRKQIKKAITLYRSFREDKPEVIRKVVVALPQAVIAVGHLDYVGYTTTHGGKTTRYEHKFRTGSRPLLCASADGKQLLLLGGNFTFTELGIVDLDSKGRQIIPESHGKQI